MTRWAINTATWIYRKTPSARIRRFYFDCFSRAVRNRRTIAVTDSVTFDFDLGSLIDLALYLGLYEPDVAAALARSCFPGAVVLDIGANIGAHALPVARRIGPTGRVFAFEPTEFAFERLRRNLSLNDLSNLTPIRVALSDRTLLAQDCDLRALWRPNGRHESFRTTVDFVCLDDWWTSQRLERVDLIKLDVDGHEFPVLAGAKALLETSHPKLILEVGRYHFEQDATNPLRLLERLGYHFCDILDEARHYDLAAIDQLCRKADSMNLIAVPDPSTST